MKQWARNYICKTLDLARKKLEESYYQQIYERTEEDAVEYEELHNFLYELEDYAMEKTKYE